MRPIDLVISVHSDDHGLDQTLQAFQDWHRIGGGAVLRLVVVDDRPSAPCAAEALEAELADRLPDVESRVLRESRPVGFVRANNLGLQCALAAGHDVLWVLSGTRLLPGTLAALLAAADAPGAFDLVAPHADRHPPWLPAVGAAPHADGAELRIAHWRAWRPHLGPWTPTALPWAPCLLIRHGVMAEVGLLPERFGTPGLESLQFALQALKAGFRATTAHGGFACWPGEDRSPGAARVEAVGWRDLLDELGYPGVEVPPTHRPEWQRASQELASSLLPDAQGRVRVALFAADLPPGHPAWQWVRGAGEHFLAEPSLGLAPTVVCSREMHALHGLQALPRQDPLLLAPHAVIVHFLSRWGAMSAPRAEHSAPVVVRVLGDEALELGLAMEHAGQGAGATEIEVWPSDGFLAADAATAATINALYPILPEGAVRTHPGSLRLSDHGTPLPWPEQAHLLVAPLRAQQPGQQALRVLRSLPDLPVSHADLRGLERPPGLGDHDLAAPPALAAARVVLMPSPILRRAAVLSCLAAGRHVVLRRSGAAAELAALLVQHGLGAGLSMYESDEELLGGLREALQSPPVANHQGSSQPDLPAWADALGRLCRDRLQDRGLRAAQVARVRQRATSYAQAGGPPMAAAVALEVPAARDRAGAALRQILEANPEQFVQLAYQALLRREADPPGIATYQAALANGASRLDVLLAISSSPEALALGAHVDGLEPLLAWHLRQVLSLDGLPFVEAAFRCTLLRPADDGGRSHYLAALEGGMPKSGVIAALARSPEGRVRGARYSRIMALARLHDPAVRSGHGAVMPGIGPLVLGD